MKNLKDFKIIVLIISILLIFNSCNSKVKIDDIGSTTIVETQGKEGFTEYKTESTTQANKETSQANKKTSKENKETTKKALNEIVLTTKKDKQELTTKKDKPTKAPPTTVKQSDVCYITIDCRTIKDNISELSDGKEAFVPNSGYILKRTPVKIKKGDTAFDILKKACSENTCTDNCKYCKKNGIHLEFTFSSSYNSYYVEGIHQLYELDCGMKSGWMYKVNGQFSQVGASSYSVKPNDEIIFLYTCDLGVDIGDKVS